LTKTDFKKKFKYLYAPSAKKAEFINVPEMNFIKIDGKGDPNSSQEFQDAIEALYALSYTLKFMIKKSDAEKDYVVSPLEGLWWVEDMNKFSIKNKDAWFWTLMIMQPEYVTQKNYETAVIEVRRKKNPTALSKARFETYNEGESAQIMHIGPFDREEPTINNLHAFIEESGKEKRGRHHEIYLSDFRKADPEKLKTIIRQPVK
jgi:hypothetical protein